MGVFSIFVSVYFLFISLFCFLFHVLFFIFISLFVNLKCNRRAVINVDIFITNKKKRCYQCQSHFHVILRAPENTVEHERYTHGRIII